MVAAETLTECLQWPHAPKPPARTSRELPGSNPKSANVELRTAVSGRTNMVAGGKTHAPFRPVPGEGAIHRAFRPVPGGARKLHAHKRCR